MGHSLHSQICRAMLCISAAYAVMQCPSIWPSHSWILSKWINISWKMFHSWVANDSSFSIPNIMAIFRHGSPNGASNAGSNRDSEPTSGFIVCCQCCDRLGVINTALPNRGKLWHLLLVVNGRIWWRRETTTKCLWKKCQSYARGNKTALNCTQW